MPRPPASPLSSPNELVELALLLRPPAPQTPESLLAWRALSFRFALQMKKKTSASVRAADPTLIPAIVPLPPGVAKKAAGLPATSVVAEFSVGKLGTPGLGSLSDVFPGLGISGVDNDDDEEAEEVEVEVVEGEEVRRHE